MPVTHPPAPLPPLPCDCSPAPDTLKPGERDGNTPAAGGAATWSASRLRASGLHACCPQAPPPGPARGPRAEYCGPQGRQSPQFGRRLQGRRSSARPTSPWRSRSSEQAGALSSPPAYSLALSESSRPGGTHDRGLLWSPRGSFCLRIRESSKFGILNTHVLTPGLQSTSCVYWSKSPNLS